MRIRLIGFLGSALIAGSALAGCATTSEGVPYGTEQSISIPYDPYNFHPDDLLAEAQSHCGAYGLSAIYEDETIDPQSVRWRYRHYRCL